MSITNRPSDLLCEYTKLLHQQKLSGVVQNDLFSKILILEGDFLANKVKQGKLSEDEIESVRALFPSNDSYFSIKHENIEKANKTMNESIDMACAYMEERNVKVNVPNEFNTLRKGFRL